MTYTRPGAGTHLVNGAGAAIKHNAPVSQSNLVGIAVKQKNDHWSDGFGAAQTDIAVGEKFWLITKGIVQVDNVAGFAKGDAVYIIAATGVLTESAAGNVKFGRVVEVVGDGRGVPTGKVRIDLDLKDSF